MTRLGGLTGTFAAVAVVIGGCAITAPVTPCPPNARCPGPTGNAGYVIATLADGRELFVKVSVADGTLTIDGPHTFQVIEP